MQIQIVNRIQFPSANPERVKTGLQDVLYIVRVDAKRTDSVLLPAELTETKAVEKAIAAEIAKRSPLLGHTFEIK